MHRTASFNRLWHRRSSGFTLLELLVVIAIVGVLLAMLLAAVQAAREAARRMHCGNNLKQIGTAIQNYADVHHSFPPGNITLGPCCKAPSYGVWSVSILPFLEQSNLYASYDPRLPLEHPAHAFLRTQNLPVYNCPSDFQAGQLLVPFSGPHNNQKWMTSSYRGMAGVSWGLPGEYKYRRHWDNSDVLSPACPRARRGALHWIGTVDNQPNDYRCESYGTITDGSSNTLLVGEYSTKTVPACTTFWAYSYTSYALSSMTPESRTLIPDYRKCVQQGDAKPCRRAFASFHAGGIIQFLKCDGSVMPISQSINMNVYWGLATIAGGEAVTFYE